MKTYSVIINHLHRTVHKLYLFEQRTLLDDSNDQNSPTVSTVLTGLLWHSSFSHGVKKPTYFSVKIFNLNECIECTFTCATKKIEAINVRLSDIHCDQKHFSVFLNHIPLRYQLEPYRRIRTIGQLQCDRFQKLLITCAKDWQKRI